jgi:hypothetical protein
MTRYRAHSPYVGDFHPDESDFVPGDFEPDDDTRRRRDEAESVLARAFGPMP